MLFKRHEWQLLTVRLGSTFWTTGGLTENEQVGNIVFPPQRQIWCPLLNVSKDILMAVYKSVLTYSVTCWYNFLSVKNRPKLSQVIKQKNRHHTELTVRSPRSGPRTGKKDAVITQDISHPRHDSFQLILSSRRYMPGKKVSKILSSDCH